MRVNFFNYSDELEKVEKINNEIALSALQDAEAVKVNVENIRQYCQNAIDILS